MRIDSWSAKARFKMLAAGMLMSAGMAYPQVSGTQTPSTMTKIVVRVMGPGIKPGSHAALPKTIYRAGEHYARIEDPPDARQRQEKLTIIAEPDAYSVNLIDKTGTVAQRQGDANDLHVPMVLPFDPNHELLNLDRLEFGDELDFFERSGAAKTAGPLINSKPTDAYVLKESFGMAKLVVRGGTDIPVTLSWQARDGTYKYEYMAYQDLPFDPALFAKPAGIRFKNVTPDTGVEEK